MYFISKILVRTRTRLNNPHTPLGQQKFRSLIIILDYIKSFAFDN
jgi:hypothetical protein